MIAGSCEFIYSQYAWHAVFRVHDTQYDLLVCADNVAGLYQAIAANNLGAADHYTFVNGIRRELDQCELDGHEIGRLSLNGLSWHGQAAKGRLVSRRFEPSDLGRHCNTAGSV